VITAEEGLSGWGIAEWRVGLCGQSGHWGGAGIPDYWDSPDTLKVPATGIPEGPL
jgi:hypothetical protein